MKITMDKKSEDYRQVRRANQCFLWCILFEVTGIMTILFWGSMGAQLAIYFLTFTFALMLVKKTNLKIPIRPIRVKSQEDWKSNSFNLMLAIGTSICGIPVAMLLNAFASVLSSSGNQTAEDINGYPLWLCLIVFAFVPAVVEEYVFRGVILEQLRIAGTLNAVFVSSLFFALLHFSPGSVLYGFFFGCVFAFVRLSTENLLMPIAMHMTFNGINVGLSFVNLLSIPNWIITMSFLVGIVGFLILFVWLLFRNPVVVEKGRYRKRNLITKEGVISICICLCIMCMLIMM